METVHKVETTMENSQSLIEGVKIIPLRQIVDERGKIMHMLKATDPHFINFGEIYFSCAWPGVVKAWHIHTSMTINNAVLSGRAKLVIYDLRKANCRRFSWGKTITVWSRFHRVWPTVTRPMATKW